MSTRLLHATFDNTAQDGTPEADLRLLFAGDHYNGDPVYYVILGTSEHLDATSQLFMGFAAKQTKLERIRTDYEQLAATRAYTAHRLSPQATGQRRIVRDSVVTGQQFRSGDDEDAYLQEWRFVDGSSRFYWVRFDHQQPGVPLRPFVPENQVTVTWGGSPRFLNLTWQSAYQG
jgi:hypothetical protein